MQKTNIFRQSIALHPLSSDRFHVLSSSRICIFVFLCLGLISFLHTFLSYLYLCPAQSLLCLRKSTFLELIMTVCLTFCTIPKLAYLQGHINILFVILRNKTNQKNEAQYTSVCIQGTCPYKIVIIRFSSVLE